MSEQRALNPRGLSNLIAFTHLLGYVQQFYPGDEAQHANWPVAAAEGIREVEEAQDAKELATRLQDFFRPLAPLAQVFPTSERARVVPPTPEASVRLLRVRHLGISTQVYNTVATRERIDLKKESVFPSGMRAPCSQAELSRPWEADLGAGVSCRIPMVVAADAEHTLPYRPGVRLPGTAAFDPDTRAAHLAGVMQVWNAMQQFSPYFDSAPIDWPGALRRALARAAQDRSGEEYLSTLRRLTAELRDGHGSVRWNKEAPLFYPPVRWDWIQGQLMVARVGLIAERGVLPGDVVTEIDGKPVLTALREKALEASGATESMRRRAEMQFVVAGQQDTPITLTLRSRQGTVRKVMLHRTLDFAAYRDLMAEPRPQPIGQIRPGIWYVDIERCPQQAFSQALPQLASAQGVVFDVRGYPRLSLTAPLEYLTDTPLTAPPIQLPLILFPDRKRMLFLPGQGFPVTPSAPRFQGKIAFITDSHAISAAETFLAMAQHYHLGTIVGAPTAGTNGNVRTLALPDGITVQFTGIKVRNYDGSRLHGRGIQPDIPVYRTYEGVIAGKDELLEAALKAVASEPGAVGATVAPASGAPFEPLRERGQYLQTLEMAETQQRKAKTQDARSLPTQVAATLQSFVGEYRTAMAVMDPALFTHPSPAAAHWLETATPLPALQEILQAAQNRQIVILNEAHHVPRGRAFALQLALALRKRGFTYFAAETFSPEVTDTVRTGYPNFHTGFYTAEPTFGDMVRQTLRAGYKLVPYETQEWDEKGDAMDRVRSRETMQARNLTQRIFRRDPHARVFIYVGYGHETEDWSKTADGREVGWMAARLQRETGIDPLTIDQTLADEHSAPEYESPDYTQAVAHFHFTVPTVFRLPSGEWQIIGGYQGKVDMQVFHPRAQYAHGRPDWLKENGYRRPYAVRPEWLPTVGRVLLQAFVASEPADAIPMDQVLLTAGQSPPCLLLPRGDYRLVLQSEDGTTRILTTIRQR